MITVYEVGNKNDYTFKLYKDTILKYALDLDDIICTKWEGFTKQKIDRNKPNEIVFKFPMFLLVDDGKLIGYCEAFIGSQEAYISSIYVAEKYRGNGNMIIMMDHIRDVCIERKIKVLTLSVLLANSEAFKKYERYGFIISGYNMALLL